MNLSKITALILLFLGALFFTSLARAAGPDMSGLTSAVDFGTVITGILAIGAAVAGAYVAFKGVQIVVGALKRA